MLSSLMKSLVSKWRLRQTKTVEKEAVKELAQDHARADDDGFAIAKRVQQDSFANKSR